MRAKQIFEFKRNTDPKTSLDIGKDSTYNKEKVYQSLVDRGVKFYFSWDIDNKEYPKLLNNIYKLEEAVNLLESERLFPSQMQLSYHHRIEINSYRILDGNHFIFNCISEEDAKILIEVLKAFTIAPTAYNRDFSIETNSAYFYYKLIVKINNFNNFHKYIK
jgi:hypothetical protein